MSTTSYEAHEIQTPQQFDPDAYLNERQTKSDLLVVEFGHGATPIARKDPDRFMGKSAYIGIEPMMRDTRGAQRQGVEEFKSTIAPENNIFFLTHDLGGRVKQDSNGELWYEGEYHAETGLPSGVADEIVLSNVVGDPLVSSDSVRSMELLSEVSRVLADSGTVVVRDTYATQDFRHFNPDTLSQVGLEIVGGIERKKDMFGNPEVLPANSMWDKLEEIYSGEKSTIVLNGKSMKIPTAGRYLFLQKRSVGRELPNAA